MAKKNCICAMASAVIMLALPCCAVTFINGDGGMVACFLLFFAVNPIATVAVGIFAGKNIRSSWFQPILSAFLFLLGAWIFFDKGEPAFLLYAAAYMLLGCTFMLITSFTVGKWRI